MGPAGPTTASLSLRLPPPTASYLPSFPPSLLPSFLSVPSLLPPFHPLCILALLPTFLPSGTPQTTHTINPPGLHGLAVHPASHPVATDEAVSSYSLRSEYNGSSTTPWSWASVKGIMGPFRIY